MESVSCARIFLSLHMEFSHISHCAHPSVVWLKICSEKCDNDTKKPFEIFQWIYQIESFEWPKVYHSSTASSSSLFMPVYRFRWCVRGFLATCLFGQDVLRDAFKAIYLRHCVILIIVLIYKIATTTTTTTTKCVHTLHAPNPNHTLKWMRDRILNIDFSLRFPLNNYTAQCTYESR